MKIRPLAAMPAWWPVSRISQFPEEIEDITHKHSLSESPQQFTLRRRGDVLK
jgi:hypothetical protein